MRLKNVLLFAGLTLTVIQRLPRVASMPQFVPATSQLSSQLKSNTFGGDVQQSTFDPFGYDSGFWRTEYTTGPPKQGPTAADNPVAASAGIRSATPQTEIARNSEDKTSDLYIYSDKLAAALNETPVIVGPSEAQTVGEADELPATTQSDWEYAALNAADGPTVGSTSSGPSTTSAIAGFVGIIIVIGAYVSSGNRHQ
ncbi:MAG: hypothetical protein WKF77_26795 [Planctomycetaceae bacterium]